MCRAILGIEDGWPYESETAADPIGVRSPTWCKCLEHNPSFAFVLLDLLIKHMLPQMHMVIATRFDPPLPLPKLCAEGQLNLSPRHFMDFAGECDTYAILAPAGRPPHPGRPRGYAPTMLRSGLPGPSIVGAYPRGRPAGIASPSRHLAFPMSFASNPFLGVQRATPFAGVRGSPPPDVPEPPFLGVQRATPFAVYRGSPTPDVPENPFLGVQRATPFAGVRGVPENPLFPLFAAAGGQSKKSEQQENPVQEKSAGEKVEGEA